MATGRAIVSDAASFEVSSLWADALGGLFFAFPPHFAVACSVAPESLPEDSGNAFANTPAKPEGAELVDSFVEFSTSTGADWTGLTIAKTFCNPGTDLRRLCVESLGTADS
jgi:hypothetical protein